MLEEEQDDEEDPDDGDARFYLQRLDAGLFTLQLADLTLVYVFNSGLPGIRNNIRNSIDINELNTFFINNRSKRENIDSIETKRHRN